MVIGETRLVLECSHIAFSFDDQAEALWPRIISPWSSRSVFALPIESHSIAG